MVGLCIGKVNIHLTMGRGFACAVPLPEALHGYNLGTGKGHKRLDPLQKGLQAG